MLEFDARELRKHNPSPALASGKERQPIFPWPVNSQREGSGARSAAAPPEQRPPRRGHRYCGVLALPSHNVVSGDFERGGGASPLGAPPRPFGSRGGVPTPSTPGGCKQAQ